MKIVVIGGSGLIGTKLVNNLRRLGHEVVAASPTSGVNTITGEGLAEALAGAQVVVELAFVGGQGSFAVLRDIRSQPPCRRSGRWRGTSRCTVGCRHRTPTCERLLPSEDGPRNPDQGLPGSLYDRPRNAVLRIRGRHRPISHRRPNDSVVTCACAAHRVG